jgi:hypothetical protein
VQGHRVQSIGVGFIAGIYLETAKSQISVLVCFVP